MSPIPSRRHRFLSRAASATALLVALLVVVPGPARGDVISSSAVAFAVEESVDVSATPDGVWEQLVRIAEWWNGDHSFSGDAANLRLEATPGGCFCETLPGGGGLIHLTVIHAAPGSLLRLSGGLGPLQEYAVHGIMQWRLEETDAGTRVTVTYRATGEVPGGLESWAAPVDGVISEQIHRLGRLVDTGGPEGE